MTGQTEHTPTPWKVFTSPDGLKVVGIGTLEGEGICDAGFGMWRWSDADGLANADLIVRAVNAHDDMLAVLNTARIVLKNRDQTPQEMKLLDAIKIVIAKAEGRS